MVPSLIGRIAGCAFAGRCPHVVDACRGSDIPLEPVDKETHLVRCIRRAEIAAMAAHAPAAAGAAP
jgi:peptide/nickel transport system ATP-binding protein